MPRIHSIRIAGLKYNQMKKQYHDTALEFHDEQLSTNALISLMNGGGKGVLLQTIFQLIKPGTAWGKKDNRLYQQFFHNENKTFIPYTFHVMICWELDGDNDRHLITGGVFSAEKHSMEDSESKRSYQIEPTFLFYSKELTEMSHFSIDEIPVYKNGNYAKAEELAVWLRINGYDSYSGIKKHKDTLTSYGINVKDWDIQKRINKSEGGVQSFFTNSETNHNLFKKKIIPIISDTLQLDSSTDDLVDMFKSQAIIAHSLPILLSRESAHHDLLEVFTPLENSLTDGIEIAKKVTVNAEKGTRLFKAIEHELAIQNSYLVEVEQEKQTLEQEKQQLLFEKDNLEYEEQNRIVIQDKEKLDEKNNEKIHIKQELETSEQEERRLITDILLKQWSVQNKEVKSLREEISIIEKQDDMKDLQEKLTENKQLIHSEYKHVYEQMVILITNYQQLQKQFQEEWSEKEEQREIHRTERAELNSELKKLEKEQGEFSVLQQERSDYFGVFALMDIDQTIKEIEEHCLKSTQEKQTLATKIKQSEDTEKSLLAEQVKNETMNQSDQKDKIELTKKLKEQLEKEKNLASRICSFLKNEIDENIVYWLKKSREEIEAHVQKMTRQLEDEKEKLWQKQIESSLNQEDYWIANRDLKEMKERLSQDVDVYYGTEFLANVSIETREKELTRNPLLPYGLILSSDDFATLDEQIFHTVFQAPVPLFIREKMGNKVQMPFELYSGNMSAFILEEGKLVEWKQEIADGVQTSEETILEYEKTMNQARKINNDIEIMLEQEMSPILIEKTEKINLQIRKREEYLTKINNQLAELIADQAAAMTKIDNVTHTIAKDREDIQLLRDFNIEVEKEELREKDRKNIEKKIFQLEAIITHETEQMNHLQEDKEKWQNEYVKWEFTGKTTLNQIQKVLANITFPTAKQAEVHYEEPDLSTGLFNRLNHLYANTENLQKSQEEINNQLARLRDKLTLENDEKLKLENKLDQINSQWSTLEVSNLPMESLQAHHQRTEQQINTYLEKKQEIEIDYERIKTKLEIEEETLTKLSHKIVRDHNKEPVNVPEQDLEKVHYQIEHRLTENNNRINHMHEIYIETEEIREQLTTQRKILASHEIDGSGDLTFERSDLVEIKANLDKVIQDWTTETNTIKKERDAHFQEVDTERSSLIADIEMKDWDKNLKSNVLKSIREVNIQEFEHVLSIIANMKKFSRTSLEQLQKEKEKGEQAQQFWASRAAMKVVKVSEMIRKMIAKMRINNEVGTFPLVQLEEDTLPRKPEDIESILQDHFLASIKKVTEKFAEINDSNKELNDTIKQMVGDEEILFVALRRRYPTLLVYNMQTNNAFMYGTAKKAYYSTWQTMNEGSDEEADGSGGQKVSARMIIMMMLLSMKDIDDTRWSPLLIDNPFGQAASEHILDPIFAVAEKLNFQLIAVAPPELIKTEISQRFPVYYKLDFKEIGGKEVVSEVQYSFRKQAKGV